MKANGVTNHLDSPQSDSQMHADDLARFREEYEAQEPELRIAHNQEDFAEGQRYILTMRDQPVLLEGDVNDEDDEMVNVDLDAVQKHKTFLRAKAKLSKGTTLGLNTAD